MKRKVKEQNVNGSETFFNTDTDTKIDLLVHEYGAPLFGGGTTLLSGA